MIVHDLGPDAVSRMTRTDLATVSQPPDSLTPPFDFHGCACGVAGFVGSPPWELHEDGDELIHVLAGSCRHTLRQAGEEIVRTLRAGDLVIVPMGCWHRNEAPGGVTLFHMTPTTGGRHSWNDPGR